MRVPVSRALLTTFIFAMSALVAFADDYMCVKKKGCDATISDRTGTRKVRFHRGDIVSTGAGWVINPTDGWHRVD